MAEAKALAINTGLSILASTTLFTLSNLFLLGLSSPKQAPLARLPHSPGSCCGHRCALTTLCFPLCFYSPMVHSAPLGFFFPLFISAFKTK